MKMGELDFGTREPPVCEDLGASAAVVVMITAMLYVIAVVKSDMDNAAIQNSAKRLAAHMAGIIRSNPAGSRKFFEHLMEWDGRHDFKLLVDMEGIADDVVHGKRVSPEDLMDLNRSDVKSDAKMRLMKFTAEVSDPDEKKFVNSLLDVLETV